MTDSLFEDRAIDCDPDFDDWGIPGEKEDRERQERFRLKEENDERERKEAIDAEYKQYQACEAGVKEQINELNELKFKLLPFLKEIKEKEEELISCFDWVWSEDEDPEYEYLHEDCETDDDKKIVDLGRDWNYEVITSWINENSLIKEERSSQ